VDRGKPDSKIHTLSDRSGLPLTVAIPAAITNDSFALMPPVMAIPVITSRRGPRRRKPTKVHAGPRSRSARGMARADIDGTDLFALVASLAWLYDHPSLAQRADHLFGVISSAVLASQAGSVVSQEGLFRRLRRSVGRRRSRYFLLKSVERLTVIGVHDAQMAIICGALICGALIRGETDSTTTPINPSPRRDRQRTNLSP